MYFKHSQWLGIGILALIAQSPAAFADIAGDMAVAEAALNREDLTDATKLYKKIAEKNHLPAQVATGELMRTAQEYEEAFGWFMMAAYQGDAAAAYYMGQMYSLGEGVEQNLEKALYWTKLAAGKNSLPAQGVLASAYRNGELGLTVDIEQAKIWETKAAALSAAEQRIIDKKMAASLAARKAAYEAAVKEAAAKQEAANKAADEKATKKVDDADEATATKAANKSEPVKAK